MAISSPLARIPSGSLSTRAVYTVPASCAFSCAATSLLPVTSTTTRKNPSGSRAVFCRAFSAFLDSALFSTALSSSLLSSMALSCTAPPAAEWSREVLSSTTLSCTALPAAALSWAPLSSTALSCSAPASASVCAIPSSCGTAAISAASDSAISSISAFKEGAGLSPFIKIGIIIIAQITAAAIGEYR